MADACLDRGWECYPSASLTFQSNRTWRSGIVAAVGSLAFLTAAGLVDDLHQRFQHGRLIASLDPPTLLGFLSQRLRPLMRSERAQETKPTAYDNEFFSFVADESLKSARIAVPIIMELLAPSSVLDLGCGPGGWLKAFEENGVKVIQGIDGEYLKPEQLLIDPRYFKAADLTKPITIDGNYDLAVCIEVCEHLPPSSAVAALETLMAAAPVVLFSAAIPGQGGTNHINERWLRYWRDRFSERGFTMVDAVRPQIRDDSRIAYYIRQNLVLFVNDQLLASSPTLNEYANQASDCDSEWIYVDLYRKWLDRGSTELGVKELLSRFPSALMKSIRHRLRRGLPSEKNV